MDDPTAESLAALTRFMVGDARLEEILAQVTELAMRAIPPASMAGITMMAGDRVATRYFTDDQVLEIDQAQYDVGDGPCLEAFRTRQVVKIDSTLDDDRWPAFCQAAARHGVRSTVSLPLVAGEGSLGALNLYAPQVSAFTAEHAEDASAFAVQAGVVLANVQAYWDAYDRGHHLAIAMESRGVIDQAKGVLMAQSGVDAHEAFDMLSRASQRENRKLHDIAAEIVERAGRTGER